MMLNVNNSFVKSTLLSNISHITHGFSCKSAGDMRNAVKLKEFTKTLALSDNFFQPTQIHGHTIIVNPNDTKPVPADGILVFRNRSLIRSIGVLTADCIPLLFTDVHGSFIGAVHSGWKGTQQNICSTMISYIQNAGVQYEDIRVSIGPHIGSCCYVVKEDRIRIFEKEFGNVSNFAYVHNGEWHLDLGRLILKQLELCGLHTHQIDSGVFCTCCQKNMFFSYRRDSKELFGEMVATIGFTNS